MKLMQLILFCLILSLLGISSIPAAAQPAAPSVPTADSPAKPAQPQPTAAGPQAGPTEAPPGAKAPLVPSNPERYWSKTERPISFTTSSGDFQIWVLLADNSNAIGGCDYQTIQKSLKDQDERKSNSYYIRTAKPLTNQTVLPLLEYSEIYVCVFKKDNGEWKLAWLNDAGVTSVSLNEYKLTSAGRIERTIDNRTAADILKAWVQPPSGGSQPDVLSLPRKAILERTDGRWDRNGQGILRFTRKIGVTGDASDAVCFKVKKITFLRAGAEVANTYALGFGNQGKAIALPLMFVLGPDFLVQDDSNFYIGVHLFVSPGANFVGGELAQILTLGLGARFDINNYIGLGAGYQFDFSGVTGGQALVALSIGSELLAKLRTK